MYLERYHNPTVKISKLSDKYDYLYRVVADPFIQIHVKDFFEMLEHLKTEMVQIVPDANFKKLSVDADICCYIQ